MPNFKKPNTNKFEPRKGGQSANHRGYRADASAPAAGAPKKRWTADDRAARSGDRPAGTRAPSTNRRPEWSPRDSKPAYGDRLDRSSNAERPAYGDRPQRPARNDSPARVPQGGRPQRDDGYERRERPTYNDGAARAERPAYGDRPATGARPQRDGGYERRERPTYNDGAARTERPAYGDRPVRTERPTYGDRPPRATYGDRPATGARPQRDGGYERREPPTYGDRPVRAERPAYNARAERPASGDRPPYKGLPASADRADPLANRSYNDRPARAERPAYNERADRPAYSDRPANRSYSDRPERADRPAYNARAERADRPAYNDRAGRPAYNTRDERPAYADRPQGSWDDRAPRNSFDDRPPRRSSDLYPTRDAKSGPHEDIVLERLEAQAITAVDVEGKTFGDLGLGDNITRQLASMGAESPFPIQAATIPDVLAGKDVLGRGKTGSGKTIAFGAPIVERLMENNGGKGRKPGRSPRALILAPTRELAMQINRTVEPIARSVGLFTTTIVGGVPQFKQVSTLQRGVDIVIATPGRVEDLVEQGRLDLSQVTITVLDEADHMCDLGFLEPVQRILTETAAGGQKLLFSATLDKGVATLVKEFLKDPAVHEVAGEDQASSTIDHRVLLIEQRDKRAIIEQLASGAGKTLIFARTRAFAEELADQLEDAGVPATSLHGDLNQSRRTRNLSLLTSGRVNVLVATDVAARGIHVDDISLVIQADAPDEYKSYLHRAGRTGRAGKQGTVVTLVSKSRKRRMDELLGRADIEASYAPARPGDNVLEELAAL